MLPNIKFRLLCRLWEDCSISPDEMEILVASGTIVPDDMILWATMNGREDLVCTLLKKGANPNKRGHNDGVPALFRAAESYKLGGTFSIINLLMKYGANPHHFMGWYDGSELHYGTIAVVAYKAFKINILKAL